MKNFGIFLALFVALATFAIVPSCSKDEVKNTNLSPDEKLMIELSKYGVTKSDKNYVESRLNCVLPQSQFDCKTFLSQPLNFQYSHPNYPGCVITVPVSVKTCYNASGMPVSVNFEILDDFQSWTYSSQCNSLKNYWANLYASNQIGTLESELVNLYKSIANYIETTHMKALLFVNQMYCPSRTVEVNLIKRSCTSFCFSFSEGVFQIYQPECGEACCARRKVMCLNANGELNVSGINFFQVGTCLDNIPNCNPGDGGGKICRTPCEFL